ncbi:nSTAND1 domain-containing NTPase [Streptosporangium sandarakinum]|uniref:nSTAND1 domain-containing NTPase n=1 Tax=Streptosporangium sandarakinum TaxID=1260955 RepID=UPI0037199F50
METWPRPWRAGSSLRRAWIWCQMVMVVDQFEELFTLSTEGSAERAAFVDALHAITMGGSGVVVVAVRGDFVDRCATRRAPVRALEEHMFVLEPMSEAELLRTITGPAAAAGLEAEKGLAEQVVRELAGHLRAPATVPARSAAGSATRRAWISPCQRDENAVPIIRAADSAAARAGCACRGGHAGCSPLWSG